MLSYFRFIAFQISTKPLFYQQTRCRAKINLKRPRAPHFAKAVIEKFVSPVYPRIGKDVHLANLCAKTTEVRPVKSLGQYEQIIAREVADHFRNSRMIAFLHRGSIKHQQSFDFQVRLHKKGMKYKSYSSGIMLEALREVNHLEAYPLVQSRFGVVFGPEVDIAFLQKTLRKTPQLILLAGIVDNQLLRLDEFVKYGSNYNETIYGEFVSVLQNAGGANLTQQLTHHPRMLVERLTAIEKCDRLTQK